MENEQVSKLVGTFRVFFLTIKVVYLIPQNPDKKNDWKLSFNITYYVLIIIMSILDDLRHRLKRVSGIPSSSVPS